MCNAANESILHALRDYNVVKPIWHQLGVHNNNFIFFISRNQRMAKHQCQIQVAVFLESPSMECVVSLRYLAYLASTQPNGL